MPLAPPVTTTTRSATSIAPRGKEESGRSSFRLARANRGRRHRQHCAHHDGEPSNGRDDSNLASEGRASEQGSCRCRTEHQESAARETVLQGDQCPRPDADPRRDHDEVHHIDQQAHTGSLRCGVRIANPATFTSKADENASCGTGSDSDRDRTTPRRCGQHELSQCGRVLSDDSAESGLEKIKRNIGGGWFPRRPIPHRISPHGRWGPRLQRALSARH